MCRRYRGTLSCAVRASGGGGHSHLSCVRVVTVSSLGGGLEAKNILFYSNVVIVTEIGVFCQPFFVFILKLLKSVGCGFAEHAGSVYP